MNKPKSSHLQRLEELILGRSPGIVEYKGGIQGKALHNESEVAIQLCEAKALAFLESHKHEEVEVIVVFKGQFTFDLEEGGKYVVEPGQVIRLAPNTLHKCSAEPGSRAIGILIPRGEGYPDVS